MTLEPISYVQFNEKEIVSFRVVDPMEGDSARGGLGKEPTERRTPSFEMGKLNLLEQN